MLTGTPNEYKILYYKSSIDKNTFERYFKESFMNNKKYNSSVNTHSNGLFFSKEITALFGIIKNRVEGTFSQQKDFSLISIYYYSPEFFKWYHIAVCIALMLISFTNVLGSHYSAIKATSIILLISLLIKDIAEYALYCVKKCKFIKLLTKSIDNPQRISMNKYYSLLADEEIY